MIRIVAIMIVLMWWSQSQAHAQGLDFRGTLSLEMALETEHREIQKADFVFRPELQGEFGSIGNFTLIGMARFDPADALEPGQPDASNDVRSSMNQRFLLGEDIDAELREAYVDFYWDDAFVRIGKQQVVWGQADGLRVLDAVNPLHFREFILGDFEQRRIPTWMVNIEKPIADAVLQFLWIPDKTYNDTPRSGTYSFKQTTVESNTSPDITSVLINKPNRFIKDDDFGVRVNGFYQGWDWSLNYLYVYDDMPVTRQRRGTDRQYDVTQNYERTHLLGGSASNAFGKVTLRLETGWLSDRFVTVENERDWIDVTRVSEISYVVGLDYQVSGDLLLSTQLFQSVLLDTPKDVNRDGTETNLTLLARHDFLNDSAELEALLMMNANDGDGVLQLSFEYAYSDHVLIGVGADVFFGKQEGRFGQFDKADRVTLMFSYGF
ncbi:hypothetical protein OE749_16650 [Aestuariibacter sp. AA17]|uniref:Alginate export domain-containing protein n=1 Tax=Fluctibacter corallii TaxID=2984329 RepID=A0ABT3ACC2_9ALTE|nr:DUF1302 family protein [Aestuariibacter sp. AA17]MCV2886326.1 hypothetical protein [Aestuariibacter sp. AA17]